MLDPMQSSGEDVCSVCPVAKLRLFSIVKIGSKVKNEKHTFPTFVHHLLMLKLLGTQSGCKVEMRPAVLLKNNCAVFEALNGSASVLPETNLELQQLLQLR